MAVTFDTIATVDWSGGNQRLVRPCKDAIWVSLWQDGQQDPPKYFRNRQLVEIWLHDLVEAELTAGRRLCLGFDFAFGYPRGFARALTGSDDPLSIWTWFEQRIEDAPTANNRFAVASAINKSLGLPAFWGCPKSQQTAYLSMTKRDPSVLPFAEKREVERRASGAFPVWQLAYAGAVGSQVFMGLPVLERLRARFAGQVAVWPFEPLDRPVALVEVWPSLYNNKITPRLAEHPIKDAVQMHVLTELISSMSEAELSKTLNVPATPEGWIFGVPV